MSNEHYLTIVYYTGHSPNEVLTESVRKQLLIAADGLPIISVTQKPIAFGENYCLGNLGFSNLSRVKQTIFGIRKARTKYIGLAEDDVFYSPDHFHVYRPVEDTIAFNLLTWSLYTWVVKEPFYSIRLRRTNTSLIAPRDLLLDALEERLHLIETEKVLNPRLFSEPGRYERNTKLKNRKTITFMSHIPNVAITHEGALAYANLGKRKRHGRIRAFDIPYWGHAKDMLKLCTP